MAVVLAHQSGIYQGPPVGIGRPADPEWVKEATGAFHQVVPRGVILETRAMPSVNYINAEELYGLSAEHCDQSVEVLAEQAGVLLGALATDETVGVASIKDKLPLTEDEPPLTIYAMELQRQPRGFRLRARLFDARSDDYDCGFAVEGEKIALRGALNLPLSPRTNRNRNRVPRHYLNFGFVVDESRAVNESEVKRQLTRVVPRRVPLLSVRPILY